MKSCRVRYGQSVSNARACAVSTPSHLARAQRCTSQSPKCARRPTSPLRLACHSAASTSSSASRAETLSMLQCSIATCSPCGNRSCHSRTWIGDFILPTPRGFISLQACRRWMECGDTDTVDATLQSSGRNGASGLRRAPWSRRQAGADQRKRTCLPTPVSTHSKVWNMKDKRVTAKCRNPLTLLAEWTGLEPATPGVTGRYSNQLNYHSSASRPSAAWLLRDAARGRRWRPLGDSNPCNHRERVVS